VWINHNLFFNIKNTDNGNGIDTCQNCFVTAVFAVADLYLKPSQLRKETNLGSE
jgi:hypothetical protein